MAILLKRCEGLVIALRSKFSERKRWVFHGFFSLLFLAAVVVLLVWADAPPLFTYIFSSFLIVSLSFFALLALRNFYVRPYQEAAAQIRTMIAGHLDPHFSSTPIRAAADLFAAITSLSVELKAKTKMIEKLERMRIDFVANVSHELKTPLTSIKGYTETLKSGATADPLVSEKFLGRIEDNADRLIAIISDLLELSHLESFPQDVHWDVFETSDLLKKLDSTFLPNLEKKHQKLQINFVDQKLEGDIKRLLHIFTNLIDNANRYCQEGATIVLSQKKDDRHWLYEVSDNGPGIPLQHQPRIFERFYRVDSDRSRDTGGTGLGLAIVKHMVLLHDGNIKLESDNGKGTRFLISFPRRKL